MGSANNAVGALQAYLAQGTAATTVSTVNNLKQNSQVTDKSFDKVFSKISENLGNTANGNAKKVVKDVIEEAKTSKTDTKELATKVDGDNKAFDETSKDQMIEDNAEVANAKETIETKGTEANEELQDAINEDGKAIITRISDTFDITEDEMINAMQVLGLMAADFINPETIIPLINEASGDGMTELITDSDIYTSLQDLMEGAESMRSELMNEFDLSEEDMQAAIDETKESFAAVMQNTEDEEIPEEAVNVNREAFIEKDPVTQKAPQSEVFSDQPATEEKAVEITTENANKGGNESSRNNLKQGAESTNLFNQIVDRIADAAPEVETFSQVSYSDRAQMENIIRQITDRITIMTSAEETSMELSLHPASLGNVNVLLSSGKDGITAKFTAQNELVKEAVEAQLVQLQQKFEENGVKVTAIEVTIASHAFEQNLNQSNENSDPSESQQGTGTKPLRRINLSELDEEEPEEEMSEAERIAVQMMAMNGNTVDFSA